MDFLNLYYLKFHLDSIAFSKASERTIALSSFDPRRTDQALLGESFSLLGISLKKYLYMSSLHLYLLVNM